MIYFKNDCFVKYNFSKIWHNSKTSLSNQTVHFASRITSISQDNNNIMLLLPLTVI